MNKEYAAGYDRAVSEQWKAVRLDDDDPKPDGAEEGGFDVNEEKERHIYLRRSRLWW